MSKISEQIRALLPKPSAREHVQREAFWALQRTKSEGQIYHGTANPKTVAKRRAKNKVARRSRAINRHH